MAPPSLYPLTFDPILKSILWGGRRLGTLLNKPLTGDAPIAESWEISDHREDVSRVNAGPLAGMSLRELVQTRGEELLGRNRGASSQRRGAQFPLLVKFLDANDVLSVQVHPNDEQGQRLANDNGKTEAWVIMHADPGSLIYAGLRSGVTRGTFADALSSGAVEPLLHRFEAKPGDCIFIPAGTVHAIGRGIVLAEIQQMSDATFRVFDWGRTGPDGLPRKLHLEEALESTDFDRGPVNPVLPRSEPIVGGTRERLVTSPYFAIERLTLHGPSEIGRDDRFTILIGLEGNVSIEHAEGSVAVALNFGQTALLPAAIEGCRVVPRGGSAVLLTCVVP